MISSRHVARDRTMYLLLLPGLVLFSLFVVLPSLSSVALSFTDWDGIGKIGFAGLQNYRSALSDQLFWDSFKNNFVIILALTTVPVAVSLVLAVTLSEFVTNRLGKPVATVFRAGFYVPQVITPVASAIAWRWILNPSWGALNHLLTGLGLGRFGRGWLGYPGSALAWVSAILIWFQIGYCLVIFIAGVQRINPAIYDAARIDGAGTVRRFLSIIVPQLNYEISVVLLTTIMYGLKLFDYVYVLTRGGPDNATSVAAYYIYLNYFTYFRVSYGAAISTLLTVGIFIISFIFMRIRMRYEQ